MNLETFCTELKKIFGITEPSTLPEIAASENLPVYSNARFVQRTITSIVVPDEIVDLPPYTFGGCEYLETVKLPSTLLTIGEGAFYNCGSLSNFDDIPSGVVSIGAQAFNGANVSSITIPSGVQAIQQGTFYGSSISSIKLHGNITDIGGLSFAYCSNLKKINIPSGVKTIGDHAFLDAALEEVILPAGVDVNVYAFTGCDGVHFKFRCSESEAPYRYPWGADNATAEYNYTGA